ncbi:hypothetical protein L1987_86040 [Smallanthus sonchifolius]|uniref:Uncharacterized protein n=1 Tax=Smallanthus sonchifolius TaxID=185202 RepID=A0ACB8XZ88_9ASTR|nr:hypothetical protein L1987_86040 [Smallanthus sonchifolius]
MRGGRPWQTVTYRKRKVSGRSWEDLGNATTFYVKNIPEGVSSTNLWKEFQQYCDIADAYVATKKDKAGNNFGFVRFRGIRNMGDMLKTLGNVFLQGAKLGVCVAKFGRNKQPMMVNTGGHTEGYMVYPKVNEGRKEGKEPMIQGYVSTNKWRMTKSYRDVVNGLDVRGSTSVSINIKDLHQPKTFMVNCMKRSAEWFMSVVIWSGQEIETGRLAWVKVRGVPFHLWDGGTFDEIGKSYGRLMVDSNSMLTKNNVAEGHFCVHTKLIHRIDEGQILTWMDKKYDMWVSEVKKTWYKVPEKDDTQMNTQKQTTHVDSNMEEGEIRDSKEDSPDDLEPDVVRSPEVEKPIGMDYSNDDAGGNQTSGLHGWADFKTVEAWEQPVAENEVTQSVTDPNSLDHKSKSGLKNGSVFFLQNDGLNIHGAQEGVDGCLAYNPRSKRKFSSHSNSSPISPSAMGGGKKMKGKSDSVETIQAQTDVVVNPYFMKTAEVSGLFEGANLPLESTGETMVQDSYGDPNLDVSAEEEVSDTINVGVSVGYEMEGFVEPIKNLVHGAGENLVPQ